MKSPNKGMNRSAQRRCRWVPVALRAPAPGYVRRYAAFAVTGVRLEPQRESERVHSQDSVLATL